MSEHWTEVERLALVDALQSVVDPHPENNGTRRDEFEGLQGTLTNFRLATHRFAEAYTPAHLAASQRPARRAILTLPRKAWAAGLATAMALCTATLAIHRPFATVVGVQTAATAAQYAADNRLLDAIDADLSTSVPPSLAPLQTTTAAGEKTTTPN